MIERETTTEDNDDSCHHLTLDERMYEIACSFPALQFKGVEQGHIPGITPTEFHDGKLSEYLYNGRGGALSSGEFILLEFLLNLAYPYYHYKFNLGDAIKTLDPRHMSACMRAMSRTYNGE